MKEELSLISHVRRMILYILVLAFPLFFLPFTQEYFVTNKMYFLFFGSLLLLLLTAFEFLLTKKMVWEKKPYDNVVVLFFISVVLSVIFSSPNKVQALLNPNYGVMVMFSYLILYFYLSREKASPARRMLVYVPAAILSVSAVLFALNPFKGAHFPAVFQFLQNPAFSPLGSPLDAAAYIGFAAVLVASQIFFKKEHEKASSPLLLGSFVLFLVGIGVSAFTIISSKALILPPINLSWYAAVETLKQPVTALFGVGVDNFSAMFTRVKDITYNNTSLWQISSFNVSRSAILHILTETGIFGAVALGLISLQLLKRNIGSKKHLIVLGSVLLFALAFPLSIVLFFILFALLSGIGIEEQHTTDEQPLVINMEKILPLYVIILILTFGFVGVAGYFGGRAYAAEVYFKQALNGFATNNAKYVYDNMRQAVILNQYIERYRINFAQTNLLIANNIASKATQQQGDKAAGKTQLSDQERQTISQAIQAAIDEAKAAVTLNPQNASNWENLAVIYRNILNVAQGADSWTVSAYQRAIVLDPQNPVYRVELGGVLFGLQSYDQAASLFEQAIGLKPDWPNAYYNFAWAAYQKQDYQKAAAAMKSTVSLLDPKRDATDYKRATADLAEFMKKVPATEEATPSAAAQEKGTLARPTPWVQPIDPKIKLPTEASPSAK